MHHHLHPIWPYCSVETIWDWLSQAWSLFCLAWLHYNGLVPLDTFLCNSTIWAPVPISKAETARSWRKKAGQCAGWAQMCKCGREGEVLKTWIDTVPMWGVKGFKWLTFNTRQYIYIAHLARAGNKSKSTEKCADLWQVEVRRRVVHWAVPKLWPKASVWPSSPPPPGPAQLYELASPAGW